MAGTMGTTVQSPPSTTEEPRESFGACDALVLMSPVMLDATSFNTGSSCLEPLGADRRVRWWTGDYC